MMTQSLTRLLLASRLPQASFQGHTCPWHREDGPAQLRICNSPAALRPDLTRVAVSLESLVSQLVENPPAMRETWVWSLGWEDPLEKGKATHSSVLAQSIPRTV